MELIENERQRVKEKLSLYAKAFKFEQVMLHFVSSQARQESVTRHLKIAFENQCFMNGNQKLAIPQNQVTRQQALVLIGDKMGIVEQ